MLDRDELRSDIQRVLGEIEAAWEQAGETADALDRDGAPDALVGALRDTTAVLEAERSRFGAIAGEWAGYRTAQAQLDERQQQLAV